jgi:ubiquinone/menaquinone biosynthesis C-methylase UbiE
MQTSPDRGPLTNLAERIIHRFVQNSAFFYYARTHFYWGTMRRMRRALAIEPGERLLDIGCGGGMGAGLTRGFYVGVDTELRYLQFANRRLRHLGTHSFLSASAMELAFRDGAFEKGMMLNVVHHLDDDMVDRFFRELRRVVRKKVFVLDHAPEHDNLVSGWLLSLDRGEHFRHRPELRQLLARHWDVEREDAFYNAEHTISHVLFTLVPPAAAKSPRQ